MFAALVVTGFLILNSSGDFNPFEKKMRLKARLRQLRVLSCEVSERAVTLHMGSDTPLDVKKIARLASERPDLYRVTPQGQIVRRATERERSAGGLALAARLLAEMTG